MTDFTTKDLLDGIFTRPFPPAHLTRVAQVKAAIASDTYVDDRKLDIAADRLLDEINAADSDAGADEAGEELDKQVNP